MATVDSEHPQLDDDSSNTRTPTLASFQIPAFRIIWFGTFLYYLSIFSGIVARGALAKELGGTNAALGLVTFAFGAVSIVMTPIGGVLADRVPKRQLLIWATAFLAVSNGALGVTELLDITRFWMLIVVAGCQAFAFATVVPARIAFTIDIVGPKLIPNAVALAQISLNSNRVIGPAVAGVFLGVAWLSFAGIYLFSAALSVLSVVAFLFLPRGLPNPDREQRSPLAELIDGVRYTRSVPAVRIVVALAILVTMVGFPYIAFLPSVSEDFFGRGSEGFALLSLVGAAGGLAAGIGVARTVLAQGPKVQVLSGIALGFSLVLMSWAPTFNIALIVAVLVGGSTAGFQSMNATLALSLSSSDYHGRVQSLLGLGFSAFGLVSYPLGLLADAIGLRQTLAGMGVITLILVVVAEMIWRPHRSNVTTSGDVTLES